MITEIRENRYQVLAVASHFTYMNFKKMLSNTLWGACSSAHFTDQETEAQRG